MSNSASICFLTLELDPVNAPGKTTTIRYDEFVRKLFKVDDLKLMKCHAGMGVSGESGELLDAIKKEVHYNKPIDRDNLVEEIGDVRFYLQAIMNVYEISETEVLQTNGYKLAKRYAGLSYSDQKAQARADKQEPGQEAA